MRKEAFRLYRRYWLPLLTMVFIAQMVIFAFTSVVMLFVQSNVLVQSITSFFSLLIYPLTLGITLICLGVWRGNAVDLGDLVSFCRDTQRLKSALWLSVRYFGLQYLFVIPMVLVATIMPTIPQSVGPIITTSIICIVAMMWISLRLLLTPYLFIDGCKTPIAESFRVMRGRALNALGFYISIGLWMLLPFIAWNIFMSMGLDINTIWGRFVIILTTIPFVPFMDIAMAAYASNIMSGSDLNLTAHNKMTIKDIYRR